MGPGDSYKRNKQHTWRCLQSQSVNRIRSERFFILKDKGVSGFMKAHMLLKVSWFMALLQGKIIGSGGTP